MKTVKVEQISMGETSKGDEMKKLTCSDLKYPVNIFKFHPLYNSVAVGDDIDVEMNGKFWNVVDPVKGAQGKSTSSWTPKQKQGGQELQKAQERKDKSIAWFNANNLAVQMCIAQNQFTKSCIQEWRNWFLDEHEEGKKIQPDNIDAF